MINIDPKALAEFVGQESCELDHLYGPVIEDLKKYAEEYRNCCEDNHRPGLRILRCEYFHDKAWGRLWVLNCLEKLIEYQEEDNGG